MTDDHDKPPENEAPASGQTAMARTMSSEVDPAQLASIVEAAETQRKAAVVAIEEARTDSKAPRPLPEIDRGWKDSEGEREAPDSEPPSLSAYASRAERTPPWLNLVIAIVIAAIVGLLIIRLLL